ncbi:uncharacterized protein LOC130673506 [Microplitis mediator]|uniref:uncharacterized protein LOC130673506 n=1 Tax=Microplitis mediator TaxID=375433 RepID=UPI002556F9CB|nr:uncharacterized protein LOC130673506 [Microplitis mediator]
MQTIMKLLVWFSKIEPRRENILDKFEMEIEDKKHFRRMFCIKLSLLTVGGLTAAMTMIHLILGVFHHEAFSNYGITIGISTIVLAKIVPYALFPYNKDSKYPSTIFYAFGVTQLIIVGMVILLLNRLDSFWRGAKSMGDNESQVFTSVFLRFSFFLQCTLVISLNERIKLPTRNDYKLKKKSWEIQKFKPQLHIPFLIIILMLKL